MGIVHPLHPPTMMQTLRRSPHSFFRPYDGDPTGLADRLMQLARNIDPRQVAINKRALKVAKPKGYVDGAVARAQVSTARVLAQARAATP